MSDSCVGRMLVVRVMLVAKVTTQNPFCPPPPNLPPAVQ